ncbi:MAG: acetyltransferase, family protein [Frankiales bacterium]|jgi:ribosomal-protein-alanine N-acetyltransferase|nr:acetyltransferase, family protein [Frankiales bacterium]
MSEEMRTERLLMRPWRDEDRVPFAALNADPVVMEHFPAPLSRSDSDAFVDRIEAHFAEHGYGLWALEDDSGFLGFTGLSWATFDAPFNPSLEVGWRLARTAWGKGYATEAAVAAVRRGLQDVERITSFTSLTNVRSWRVMERIGMRRDSEFEHPRVPEGHPVRRHVLYVADRDSWPTPA